MKIFCLQVWHSLEVSIEDVMFEVFLERFEMFFNEKWKQLSQAFPEIALSCSWNCASLIEIDLSLKLFIELEGKEWRKQIFIRLRIKLETTFRYRHQWEKIQRLLMPDPPFLAILLYWYGKEHLIRSFVAALWLHGLLHCVQQILWQRFFLTKIPSPCSGRAVPKLIIFHSHVTMCRKAWFFYTTEKKLKAIKKLIPDHAWTFISSL